MNLIQKIFSFFKKEKEKNTNTSDLNMECVDIRMNPAFKDAKMTLTGDFDSFERSTSGRIYPKEAFKKALEKLDKDDLLFGELDHPEQDLTEVFQYRKDKKDLLICELELPVHDLTDLYQYCTDNNIEIPSFSEFSSLTYPYRMYDEENYIKHHELSLKQDENYRRLHEQYSDYYKVFMKFNKQY